MQELLSTNNMVTISFVESLLREADIYHQVLDQNMSVLEGSIGIIPRRIMVEDAMIRQARALVEDAGIAIRIEKTMNSAVTSSTSWRQQLPLRFGRFHQPRRISCRSLRSDAAKRLGSPQRS